MAADDEKQTYRHSSIVTEENLDQYGVWVKSGPESVDEDDSADTDISDLEPEMDLEEFESGGDRLDEPHSPSEEDALDALPDMPEDPGTDLSEEEEQLLADLEDADADIEAPDSDREDASEPNTSEDLDLAIPEEEEEFSMDLEDDFGVDQDSKDTADAWSYGLPDSDDSQSELGADAPFESGVADSEPSGQLEEAGADDPFESGVADSEPSGQLEEA
ncbi:MAG: hypothetical protein ACLFM0_09120, partial [Spirochaetales bacterium]